MNVFALFFSLVFFAATCSLACQDSTAANRVVYLGDSHTAGGFGASLAQNLTQLYDTSSIKRYGVIGASSQHWSKKDNSSIKKLKIGYYCDGDGNKSGAVPNNFPSPTQLFLGVAPERVVIALGTNDVHNGCLVKDKDSQMAATKELLAQIRPGSKCTWVGPTEQPNDGPIAKRCGQDKVKSFINNLRDTVSSRCTFIDSRKITQNGKPIMPNAGDKLHFTGKLAVYWADGVAKMMDSSQALSKPSHLKKAGQIN